MRGKIQIDDDTLGEESSAGLTSDIKSIVDSMGTALLVEENKCRTDYDQSHE